MRHGYTNVENVSYKGVSSNRETLKWITDLDGEPVELAEAIGWWSAGVMHSNFQDTDFANIASQPVTAKRTPARLS